MAKKVTVELIDDISGQPGATTTRFGLDGINYEIDLVDDSALRELLAPYITKSRTAAGKTKRTSGGKRQQPHQHLVRQWARQHGYNVPARGRLPAALLRAYSQHSAEDRRSDHGAA